MPLWLQKGHSASSWDWRPFLPLYCSVGPVSGPADGLPLASRGLSLGLSPHTCLGLWLPGTRSSLTGSSGAPGKGERQLSTAHGPRPILEAPGGEEGLCHLTEVGSLTMTGPVP